MLTFIKNGFLDIIGSIRGHSIAIHHRMRGHKIEWSGGILPWIGYFGSVSCIDCPDCDGASLLIWSRNSIAIQNLARAICSSLGHGKLENPKIWNGEFDSEGNMICPEVSDRWECSRCFTELSNL